MGRSSQVVRTTVGRRGHCTKRKKPIAHECLGPGLERTGVPGREVCGEGAGVHGHQGKTWARVLSIILKILPCP
jgi:hypothetical protein